MRTTPEKPWMCSSCGYVMDAATAVKGNAAPKDGDVSLCLRCAAIYERRSGAWAPATHDEVMTWPAGVRRQVAHAAAQIMTSQRRAGGGSGNRLPGACKSH